jgi:hypothetical protein
MDCLGVSVLYLRGWGSARLLDFELVCCDLLVEMTEVLVNYGGSSGDVMGGEAEGFS